ncbi:AbrB/MazE/SpoVT family DNA-binding domain-containing protein [Aquifex sp.]
MLVKKTSKNQITLPKEVIKEFPNVEYFEVKVEEGRIVLIPVRTIPADINLEKIREKIRKRGLTEREVEKAVEWARKS